LSSVSPSLLWIGRLTFLLHFHVLSPPPLDWLLHAAPLIDFTACCLKSLALLLFLSIPSPFFPFFELAFCLALFGGPFGRSSLGTYNKGFFQPGRKRLLFFRFRFCMPQGLLTTDSLPRLHGHRCNFFPLIGEVSGRMGPQLFLHFFPRCGRETRLRQLSGRPLFFVGPSHIICSTPRRTPRNYYSSQEAASLSVKKREVFLPFYFGECDDPTQPFALPKGPTS